LKLISLELTNYRRFKKTLIEFPEGVIGILGLNGVGKSTIIEAIAWAMYGNQQTIVRTKKEDLKRHGATPADVCEVKLSFELDGDGYLITRKMAGKNYQTTAELSVNGRAEANSTKAVTKLIEHRLGMDYQAFYTSVFAKQKELNALSDIEPNKRKKLILRMLNIDSIDKAIISVHTDKKVLNTKLNENRSLIRDHEGTPKIEIYKDQIKEYNSEAKSLTNDITVIEEQRKELDTKLRVLKNERAAQQKLRGEFNKLTTRRAEAQTSLKNITAQQTKIEHELSVLSDQEAELEKLTPKKEEWGKVRTQKAELEVAHMKYIRSKELEKQLKGVDTQIEKHESKRQESSKQLKKFENLTKELEEFQVGRSKLEAEVEEKRRSRSELVTKEEHMKNELVKLKDRLDQISKLGAESECPTCERVLGEHYEILEEKFNSEIKEMASKLTETSSAKDVVEKEFNDVQKRQEATNKREKYLIEQTEQRARVESTIKASEDELEHYRSQQQKLVDELEQYKDLNFDSEKFEQLKSTYQTLEKVNEKIIVLTERVEKIPKLKKDLDGEKKAQKTITENLAQFEDRLKKLGFDEKMLAKLDEKYDDGLKKLKEYELGLKDVQNKLSLNREKIEQLTNRIEELTELEIKIKSYEEELMYLVKLDGILNKFKNYMISRVSPTLTLYGSDLFRNLTDGKYNRLEVDNDYNVYLYDDGTPFPLNRFSGGEEDLANLCLRLAISQVITAQAGTSNLNFIILDEVFGSQDLHRKRNLLQALNGLTSKFRQIFLITHIEDVKDFIEYNISVIENDDGTSSVKVI